MCGGAPLVSHRHRPADDGSRLVRHTEEIRTEGVRQGGERCATLALCAILITTKKTGGDCYNEYQYLTFLLSECSIAVCSRTWSVDYHQSIWRLYNRIFWSVEIDKQERIGEFRHFKAILSISARSDDKVIIRKILTAQRAFFAFLEKMWFIVWMFGCLVEK